MPQAPSGRADRSGLLLFAHGARDPRWALPFESIRDRIRAIDAQRPVVLAFLEFMTPALPEAASSLVQQGCGHIDVLPLFLGAGGHVRKDLPGLINQARAAHPGLSITLHPAIGEVEAVVEAMAQAAVALATSSPRWPTSLSPADGSQGSKAKGNETAPRSA